MACMCGDLYCRSCGPAQGNSRCEMCGAWSADGGCENLAECSRLQADFERERDKFEDALEQAISSYKWWETVRAQGGSE